jgi:uncharacterized protein YbjQ (UPF0145 family)
MKYLIKLSSGQVMPCDEEVALQRMESDPNCLVAKFGTNHWIRAQTFMEYGDIGFENRDFRVLSAQPDMAQTELLITTETFPPYTICARLGVVVAERVAGVNLLKEVAIGLTDLVGGPSLTLQNELSQARKEVINDLKRQAASMGAHGLIALGLTYNPIESKNTMMVMVAGWATAVTFSGETNG